MTETVWISLIAASSGIIGPGILAVMAYIFARNSRAQDYARQDEVAAQAATAARLLLEAQERMAGKAREVATVLAVTNAATGQKLDVIHTLVNSNYTEIMQTLLDALQAQLALMKGADAQPADVGVVEKRISDLKGSLQDRGRIAAQGERP